VPWDTDHPAPVQRADFVALVRSGVCSFARACADFGVSRKTGYKWLARAADLAPRPLRDHSRRPRHCPRRTPPAVEQAVLDAHARHPWGARKLHAFLCRSLADAPSRGTVHNILVRHARAGGGGLPPPAQRFERPAANDLWQMDFKGPLDGWPHARYLLSVLDDHSRYLLDVRLCGDMTLATAWDTLWELFGEVGLPEAILSDNAFGARGHGTALSWLEVRLERLGVLHPHGRPYHPQTQGKVERYHRTLGREAVGRLTAGQPDADAQRVLDAWRAEYNHVRPHEGVGHAVPAERWRRSDRPRPPTLPAAAVKAGADVRRVQGRGEISWRGYELAVGQGLAGERVGVTEEGGRITVWFGERRLRELNADALVKGRTN
jgi:transposase InsO family protein